MISGASVGGSVQSLLTATVSSLTASQWYVIAAAVAGIGVGFNLAVAVIVLVLWRAERASDG